MELNDYFPRIKNLTVYISIINSHEGYNQLRKSIVFREIKAWHMS